MDYSFNLNSPKTNLVELNKELGLWLLENNFSDNIRNKILYFINEVYMQGFKSGYSECKIVNFIDEDIKIEDNPCRLCGTQRCYPEYCAELHPELKHKKVEFK